MRAVLFDYDGTLNNSLEATFHAFQGVAKELDLRSITLQQFLNWYTPTWYVVYEKMGVPVASWRKADKIWLNYYNKRKTKLFPNSIETLKQLKFIDFQVGLVTGGTRSRVEKELKKSHIHDLFDVIIYGSDVQKEDLKPSSTQIIIALQRLEAKSRETLYVGDTPIDVLAGKKAEVITVAVTWGFSTAERLKQAKPDFIVYSFSELMNAIRECFSYNARED